MLPGVPPSAAPSTQVPCAELAEEYQRLLPGVTFCNPDASELECAGELPARLGCPCVIPVNDTFADDLAELEGIRERWNRQRCRASCPSLCSETAATSACRAVCVLGDQVLGVCESVPALSD